MANTSFDDIHNFSLIIIRDYVLDSLMMILQQILIL